MHLNATQLDFLGRLGKSPDGQQLLALIQAEITECNIQLRRLSGDALLREQGKAMYLDRLATWLKPFVSVTAPPKRIPVLPGELS